MGSQVNWTEPFLLVGQMLVGADRDSSRPSACTGDEGVSAATTTTGTPSRVKVSNITNTRFTLATVSEKKEDLLC